MAMIYALKQGDRFIAAGTAKEIAKKLKVSTADVRKMASEKWRKKYPKMPYTEFLSVRLEQDEHWKPSREHDTVVYKLVKMGLSFSDVADSIGISELMAENAYNRVSNGRYGPCDFL